MVCIARSRTMTPPQPTTKADRTMSTRKHKHYINKNKDYSVSKIIGGHGSGVYSGGRRFHGFKHGYTGAQLENLAVRYLFPHSVIDDSLEDKDMRDLKMLRMHFHLQATDKDYDLKPATCGQRNREFHLMPDEVDSESRT